MESRAITKQMLVDAVTQRPEGAPPISREELLHRLDIILATFTGPVSAQSAANTLRGALIRLAQAYGDPLVEAKINRLIGLTLDIPGI
jgi:hypothetical protein